MEKIYLAGFDVFYKDAKTRFDRMRTLCELAGYEALIPLDNEITEGLGISNRIYKANIDMIERADGIIANLNAFRGTEPDSGTVFEVGYGVAKNKKIVGYTLIEDWKTHIIGDQKSQILTRGLFDSMFNQQPVDEFNVEDFGLPLNLMLAESINLINGDFIDALEVYNELSNNTESTNT